MAEGSDKTEIMVFRPTMEEFKDFHGYVKYMERCGAHKFGGAKVIPPKGWLARRSYENVDVNITCPIEQSFSGGQGLFRLFNVQKKAVSVAQFRELALSDKFKPPVNVDDFDEIDRRYWKSLMFNPPMYGADLPGTLFDADVHTWNVSRLDSILTQLQLPIPGVNTPYLYFGMWRATFAWHTEDMDLYSINYLHYGAPKTWYFVPDEHGQRIERLAKGFFPGDAQACASFLRHKSTLISPTILRQYSIPVNRVTQEAGQFIITFPYSYHCGFNHGYNCAESTNFALERWIEYGIKASHCYCQGDSVHINMELFIKKFKPHLLDSYKATQLKNGFGPLSDSALAPAEGGGGGGVSRSRRMNHRKRSSMGDDDHQSPTKISGLRTKASKSATTSCEQQQQLHGQQLPFDMSMFWEEVQFNQRCAQNNTYCCVCSLFEAPRPKIVYPTGPILGNDVSTGPQRSNGNSSTVARTSTLPAIGNSDEGTLIVCSCCGICVHKECYGLPDEEMTSSWQCNRCKQKHWDKVCVLCNLRGGALKPTDASQPKWAHIACAVAIPEVSFGNYKLREPIQVKAIQKDRWTLRCRYCTASGRPSRGTCVQCSGPRCFASFHVTCAYRAGLLIRLSDTVVQFFCSKHSQDDLDEEGSRSTIRVGAMVAAKYSTSEFAWANVVGIEFAMYYVVLFDDGSISHNVRPGDVKNIQCGSQNLPEENQRVEILWSDGERYWGKFLRATRQPEYKVRFLSGRTITVESDELFEMGRVPKKVKFLKALWNTSPSPGPV
ncbi:lysine-specific demethylase 4A-like isoform X2 [Oscarella lobularis]|uniref:lysine-specific demethylase 4A-like isoform X2 n=1 Tax=Oscarella lobularis TaxID=121494 RepID=UPI0033140853